MSAPGANQPPTAAGVSDDESPEFSVSKVAPAADETAGEGSAAALVKAGHGAQVVRVREDHSYELDEEELRRVLLRDELRGLPVAVVSVAGAYRGGKSFLLNFFLRYLTAPAAARADGSWLGAAGAPLEGFSWRGGSVRNTTGILMWSEPAVLALPSGDKVAVLVLDTQGTFDNASTVRDCSTIFALSTLLSSVQVYNLSMNINEDDLQHLQLFTEYGKLARDASDSKPFQALQFLVRDWPYPWEFPYGADGGERLLQSKLKVDEKTPAELKELRAQLYESFDRISGFLMPHPGFAVANPKFKGNVNELLPEFRTQLTELVASLFNPEKLIIKTMSGERVTTRDLFTYFKTYMELFNSDKLPTPKNIMEATVTAALLNATSEAREQYARGVEAECGAARPSLPARDLRALHRDLLAAAERAFHRKRKMGAADQAAKYLDDLIKELDEGFPQIEMNNLAKLEMTNKKAKEEYEATFQKVSQGRLLCLHPLHLQQLHREGLAAALKVFDDNRRVLAPDAPDEDRLKLEQSLNERYASLQLSNELNNNTVVTRAAAQYSAAMDAVCGREPPLREDAFAREHAAAHLAAIARFASERNRPDDFPQDPYKQNLTAEIKSIFSQLNAMNNSKYKATALAMRRDAMNVARQLYERDMQAACGPAQHSVPDADLDALHRATLDKAKDTFAAKITMGTQQESDEYLRELVKELEGRLPQYQQSNKSKLQSATTKAMEAYYRTVRGAAGGAERPLCLHARDLDQLHRNGVSAALKVFDANRKLVFSKTDDERAKFEQGLKEQLGELQRINEHNNKAAVTELRAEYTKHMQAVCGREPPLEEPAFKREHDAALKKAQSDFDSKRNKPNSYSKDDYKLILTTEIDIVFHQLNALNLSKFNQTAQAGMRRVMDEARTLYDTKMVVECGSKTISMPAEDLDALHRTHLAAARLHFTTNVTMIDKKETEKHLEKLTRELEGRLLMYQQYNTSKLHAAGKAALEAYEEAIRGVTGDRPVCAHPADLLAAHDAGVKAALKVFAASRKMLAERTDEAATQLNSMLTKRFNMLKLNNESNNSTLVKDIHTEYWKRMETNCNRLPPYSDAEFLVQHESALKTALKEFHERRHSSAQHAQDFYKTDLEERIKTTYNEFKNINVTHRLEKEMLKAEREHNKEEQERLKKEQEYAKQLQQSFTKIHEKELQEREQERLEREATLNTLKQQLELEQQTYKKQQEEMTRQFNSYRESQQDEITRLNAQTQQLQELVNELSRPPPASSGGCVIL